MYDTMIESLFKSYLSYVMYEQITPFFNLFPDIRMHMFDSDLQGNSFSTTIILA